MKILVMGGTGAIGKELVPLLAQDPSNTVVVTSRRKSGCIDGAQYIQGNAKSIDFIKQVLADYEFDVIVDFMLYSVDEFKDRYEILLNSCSQYLFLSSARVYAASHDLVKEDSARLLDVSTDMQFLKSGEYSLTKAKEEDILKASRYRNWTIVRPYKTYNNDRLQLGVFEIDQWLYRAMSGKTVVIPGNIKDLYTSMTYAKDTAKILALLLEPQNLGCEIIQIANPEKITWGQIVDIYSQCIQNKLGIKMDVYYAADTSEIECMFNNRYRIQYDGLISRVFDDSKVSLLAGKEFAWTDSEKGLTECLYSAMERYLTKMPDYAFEGMCDRMVRQYCNLRTIPGNRQRLKYLLHRTLKETTIKRMRKIVNI